MTTSTNEELDRNTSGRFVRNLALSLSGGALLTLIGAGATVAAAQDGAAGTASDGQGAAGTGDATAVGNQSGTNTTQTVTVSGNLGVIQVINQNARVNNTGSAVANTGNNIAIGNESINNADADQDSSGGSTGAFNNGDAANSSNGSALINTGNATAVGNQSNTNIVQDAHSDIAGSLGSILVINQDAVVSNDGTATANTGGSERAPQTATGNTSDNDSGLLQDADAAGLANNNGRATNNSDGKATINTGNASATGNRSNTNITQRASGSAGGSMGGLLIISQDALVTNDGTAYANTGDNDAVGNESDSEADADQDAGFVEGATADIGIASNNGEASNYSDGSANISTGDATAIGNDSSTTINQSANGNVGLNGMSLVSQNANVDNDGTATAETGVNTATGNTSDNDADIDDQDVDTDGFTEIGVAANFGKATNASAGTANIDSGAATAVGTRSQDSITQDAKVLGGALNLQTQNSDITNDGEAYAYSGYNNSTGNESDNAADLNQDATLDPNDNDVDGAIDTAVMGQFGLASNASDGTASITTGDATAIGNDSSTNISQVIDPTGVTIQTQNAEVDNEGYAESDTGENDAVGNTSDNDIEEFDQDLDIDPADDLEADTLVGANNGEASNASDGTATIVTGDATAVGNRSHTTIDQVANASISGTGLVINPQTATVTNDGYAEAYSGYNTATGNDSESDVDELDQDIDLDGDDVEEVGTLVLSNNGTASNASDGTASVHTGDALASGNDSTTEVHQRAGADVVGSGLILNPQTATVDNAGQGYAETGYNDAYGNTSTSVVAEFDQDIQAGDPDPDVDNDLVADQLILSNQGTASNASDGTAEIHTGDAKAAGNTSATLLVQDANGAVDGSGLILNAQTAAISNEGYGEAITGQNVAYGNDSESDADLDQDINVNEDGDELEVDGPLTASNNGTASNASDGTAIIKTGGAQAQGNVSSSILTQYADGVIVEGGSGLIPNIQDAEIVNEGAALAESGFNEAYGNESDNDAELDQEAEIDPEGADLFVDGPATVFNNGTASNASDGTAKIHTGGALASGNVSASNLNQTIDASVGGPGTAGLVVAPQSAFISNTGGTFDGVPGDVSFQLGAYANTGDNISTGNASVNDADTDQEADFEYDGDLDVAPALTVGNNGDASNVSDGFACTCTGNAWASGNISSSTLIQDMQITVPNGVSVVPTDGEITNEGTAEANSGRNDATGNESDNTAETTQEVELDTDGTLDGAQTFVNGGGARNTSNGTGKVGTGNAKATGNHSDSNLLQAAVVDGAGAFATITGDIENFGDADANSGDNSATGNASTNEAYLDQFAAGEGTVANQGWASNDSDGFGGVGDPDCEDKVVVETPETPETPGTPGTPGLPGLPKTGGPLEVEAAIGLMLLLAGFGFRRASKRLS